MAHQSGTNHMSHQELTQELSRGVITVKHTHTPWSLLGLSLVASALIGCELESHQAPSSSGELLQINQAFEQDEHTTEGDEVLGGEEEVEVSCEDERYEGDEHEGGEGEEHEGDEGEEHEGDEREGDESVPSLPPELPEANPEPDPSGEPPAPSTGLAPTLDWRYGYGVDSTEEHPHHGIQTQNGGFAVIGERYIGERARIFVVVTDAAGNQIFTKDLGANRWNNGNQILEEPNGNFLVGGSWDSGSGAAQEHERVIIRLSPQGEELARRTYPAQGRDAIRGLSLNADGSIIAVGYQSAAYDDETFIISSGVSFVMKVSAELNLVWERAIDNPYELKRVLPNQDSSGYVGFGSCRTETSETHFCLIFMDLSGRVLQTRIYGDGHGYDFDRTSDGGFIMGGHKVVNQGWDGWAIRVNAQGDELWNTTFGQPNGGTSTQLFEECYGVKSVPWGGYVLGCGSGVEPDNIANPNDPLNVWRAYVVRLDESGELSWHRTYSDGEGDDAAEYIVPTADRGFAVFTDSSELGGQLGIYKLSPEQ